jgi:hypothetical protein
VAFAKAVKGSIQTGRVKKEKNWEWEKWSPKKDLEI